MDLSIPDYVIVALTSVGAVVGLFLGVSGALAFLTGTAAASAAGFFAWPLSADLIVSPWMRGLAVGVLALLVFGSVRWGVKKFVHSLIAQPGDALIGSLLAALTCGILSLGIAWGLRFMFPDSPEFTSVLLEKVLVLVGR